MTIRLMEQHAGLSVWFGASWPLGVTPRRDSDLADGDYGLKELETFLDFDRYAEIKDGGTSMWKLRVVCHTNVLLG